RRCQAHAMLGQEIVVLDQRLDRAAEVFEHLDDLPDVEARPDHPRTPPRVLAAERNPGETAHLHRLVGERLDDHALRPLQALRFGFDSAIRRRRKTDAERLAFGRPCHRPALYTKLTTCLKWPIPI